MKYAIVPAWAYQLLHIDPAITTTPFPFLGSPNLAVEFAVPWPPIGVGSGWLMTGCGSWTNLISFLPWAPSFTIHSTGFPTKRNSGWARDCVRLIINTTIEITNMNRTLQTSTNRLMVVVKSSQIYIQLHVNSPFNYHHNKQKHLGLLAHFDSGGHCCSFAYAPAGRCSVDLWHFRVKGKKVILIRGVGLPIKVRTY